ncbi:MAG: lipopolysaccharide heptosyltransferase II [Candidatus Omnitrophica bacterium]|nr:lipopolysaccharide heptosyltransferase II [Candidatus Omnitrophota bacterium]
MKILVVTLSNLGDVVLTLPVFEALKRQSPEVQIHAVASPSAAVVLESDPRVQKLIPYNKKISLIGKIGFLAKIREERYDTIIDLRHSLIGLLGGAKRRNNYFLFRKQSMHRARRHLAALEGIADTSLPDGPLLSVAPSKLFDGEKRLVVAAIGSKSDIKKWPAEYYAELLDRLAVNEDCDIALVGDKQDAPDAEKVKSLMKHAALDLCGKTSFEELKSVIRAASLVVTNDSAPLHIADAMDIPTLALFGPTDPRKYGPRSGHSIALRKPLFCAPCEKAQCRYHHECMIELLPLEVYEQARRLLGHEWKSSGGLRVLFIRLDRIGDLALSLPAVEAVKEQFPNAHLSLMTRSYTQDLLQGHPLLDEVIPYRYEKGGRHRSLLGYWRFLKEIRRRNFDVVFILHPSTRSHLLPALAGIPYRVGFDSRLPFLLTHRAADRRHEGKRHESEYTLDVVRAFGVQSSPDKKFEIPLTAYDIQKPKSGGMIALHPGASCPSKRWPQERYAELARQLKEKLGLPIALIGGKEEMELGKALSSRLGDGVVDLTGRLSLRELTIFLKSCRLLISNDSGPVHVAAAVGTPVLTLFGRNAAGLSAARWKPLGAGHRIIQKDVGCVTCLAHRCTINFECLKAISTEEVSATAVDMLMKPQ